MWRLCDLGYQQALAGRLAAALPGTLGRPDDGAGAIETALGVPVEIEADGPDAAEKISPKQFLGTPNLME